MKYEITLKNEKTRAYYLLSWIFVFLHILVFAYLAIASSVNRVKTPAIISVGLILIILVIRHYSKNLKFRMGFQYFLMACMIGWITMEQYLLAGAVVLFDILNAIALRPWISVFTKDKIIYPSLFRRTIEWNELNNTIMKDGILTIDFKNNKLIQQQVDTQLTRIDEKEFNEFCNMQLGK